MNIAKKTGLAASLLGMLASTAIGCGGSKGAEPIVNIPEQGQVLFVPGNSTEPYYGIDLITGEQSNADMKMNAYKNIPGGTLASYLKFDNISNGNASFPRNDIDTEAQKAELELINKQVAGAKQYLGDLEKDGVLYHLYVDFDLPEKKLQEVREKIEGHYIQLLETPTDTVIRNREQWVLVHPDQFEIDYVYRKPGFENVDWNSIKGTLSEIPQQYDIWEVLIAEYDGGSNSVTDKQTSGIIRAKIGYRDNKTGELQIYNGELKILVRENGEIGNDALQQRIVYDITGNKLEFLAGEPYIKGYSKLRNTDFISYRADQLRIAGAGWNDRN